MSSRQNAFHKIEFRDILLQFRHVVRYRRILQISRHVCARRPSNHFQEGGKIQIHRRWPDDNRIGKRQLSLDEIGNAKRFKIGKVFGAVAAFEHTIRSHFDVNFVFTKPRIEKVVCPFFESRPVLRGTFGKIVNDRISQSTIIVQRRSRSILRKFLT